MMPDLENQTTGLPPREQLSSRKARALHRAFSFFGVLPLWLNHLLASMLAALLMLIPNRHRRVTWHNISLCFGERSLPRRWLFLYRSLRESTKGVTEMGVFWTRPPEHTLGLVREVRGAELLDEPLRQGRPVLFGAPHIGAWELLNLYLSSRAHCAFLYRERHDADSDALIKHARERFGAELIAANRVGVRQLLRHLKTGGLVGILPDHQPRRGQGVFAPFFGRDAFTMVLFPKLAQRQDAAVVLGCAERLSFGRGYRIRLVKPPQSIRDPDLEVSAQALNQGVEALARTCIHQYEWTYKRFGVRPGGRFDDYGESD